MTTTLSFEIPPLKPDGFLDGLVAEIIANIEAGTPEERPLWFSKPGPLEPPASIATGAPYCGSLAPFLAHTAREMGWSSKFWGTIAEWQARGCALPPTRMVIDPADPRLLNADQVVGCDAAKTRAVVAPFDRRTTPMFRLAAQAHVRIALADVGPTYSPKFDVIHLPAPEYVYGSDDISPVAAFQIAGFHEIMHYAEFRIMPRRSAFPQSGDPDRRGMSA